MKKIVVLLVLLYSCNTTNTPLIVNRVDVSYTNDGKRYITIYINNDQAQIGSDSLYQVGDTLK